MNRLPSFYFAKFANVNPRPIPTARAMTSATMMVSMM